MLDYDAKVFKTMFVKIVLGMQQSTRVLFLLGIDVSSLFQSKQALLNYLNYPVAVTVPLIVFTFFTKVPRKMLAVWNPFIQEFEFLV